MKKLRLCIIILAGILLLGLILYHIPQHRQVSMWACSLSGEPAQVEMNFEYYRRLFGESTVKGTVSFNGMEYVDEESMRKTFPNLIIGDSYPVQDSQKEAGALPANMIFCKKTATDILEAECNRIIFFDVSEKDSFEKIHFVYTDESMQDENGSIHGISYFGPAQTVEEAQQIATYFGRDVN